MERSGHRRGRSLARIERRERNASREKEWRVGKEEGKKEYMFPY
jgi:hypothetical protein